MSSLVISDAGLNIKGISKQNASAPTQVLSLNLSDGVIEEMIKCVQNDMSIQISLGDSPVSNEQASYLFYTCEKEERTEQTIEKSKNLRGS